MAQQKMQHVNVEGEQGDVLCYLCKTSGIRSYTRVSHVLLH